MGVMKKYNCTEQLSVVEGKKNRILKSGVNFHNLLLFSPRKQNFSYHCFYYCYSSNC